MEYLVLTTTTSFLIGIVVGWHFLPQPAWVATVLKWYHGIKAPAPVVVTVHDKAPEPKATTVLLTETKTETKVDPSVTTLTTNTVVTPIAAPVTLTE